MRKQLNLYCKCGAAWTFNVEEPVARKLEEIFWSHHSGDEHGPATASEAYLARQRHDEQVIMESQQ